MSVFFMVMASFTFLPLIHSVARELDAIAEPQPKVLNFASTIFPCSSTLIWSFMTSPQAGAPTRPVPTFSSFLFNEPTLRGFS
uniref:Putative secreted protein n=1 Tax=Ixodes ricinus TaxID=34613 RepID=A0A6B0U989_IXORI